MIEAALGGQRQGPEIRLSAADGRLFMRVAALKGAPAAEVTLVAYETEAETKVLRGENAGRALTEYSIVRGVYPLGAWHGDSAEFSIDLASIAGDSTMAAVLVQGTDQGPMIGTATIKIR